LRALKDAEKLKDKKLMIRIYNNIGFLYTEIGDNKKALQYYYKILPLLNAVNNDKNIVTTLYINLGFVHERMDRLDSAKFYNNKAYDIAIQGLEYGYQVIVMNNFGNIYMKMNQLEMALINYRQCLPYANSTNWVSIICESSMGIAKIYEAKQQRDSAIQYAKASVQAAMNAQYTKFVMEGSSYLADIYKQSGKLDSTVKYISLAMAAKDSLFNREKLNKLKAIDFEEISRQQEIAQADEAALYERKQNIQYAIIAISILCFLVLLLLLSRSIIVNQNWIRFFGVMSLLLVFEFINLYLHPYLSAITHHSPILMLLAMVVIAAFLIPIHHKLEHWGIKLLVEKNRKIRLETAKKIVADLEEKE
ncbi:MAG: tetratricopeptide repeat protein, partial [Chitinophagaceae bacterium]